MSVTETTVTVPVEPDVDEYADSTEFPHIDRDRFYDAALAWVNEKRVADGRRPLHRLPRACASSVCGCVLGRATGYRFHDDGTYRPDRGMPVGELPRDVAEFESRFERGGYPDLLAAIFSPHNVPDYVIMSNRSVAVYDDGDAAETAFPVIV